MPAGSYSMRRGAYTPGFVITHHTCLVLWTDFPTPRRYLAIFAISCGTAPNVIDGAIPNVALPTIAGTWE